MPYGLKNALSTFVRDTQKTVRDLICGIMEVYVDDIVVKSRLRTLFLQDLAKVFDRLFSTRMMLNLEKCGFMVSQ
jgi:hypothetical protein